MLLYYYIQPGELISDLLPHVQFLFRIHFGLEAHLLWLPRSVYDHIVSTGPVRRGKNYAFAVPREYLDFVLREKELNITIQMAFVGTDLVLAVVDHNILLNIHVIQLKKDCCASDFQPSSTVSDSCTYPLYYNR